MHSWGLYTCMYKNPSVFKVKKTTHSVHWKKLDFGCKLKLCGLTIRMTCWHYVETLSCDTTHQGAAIFNQPATWLTSFAMFWEAYEQSSMYSRKN